MNETPIKVAFLISGLENGGAEMMLCRLLSRMDSRRFTPTIISLTGYGPSARMFEALDIPLHVLDLKYNMGIFGGLVRLIKLLRQLKPDILQGWMYHANLVAQMVSWFLPGRPPVVWNVRATPSQLREFGFLTALIIWLSGKLSFLPVRVINNSMVSARLHEQRFGYRHARQLVIPNGFDTAHFTPARAAKACFRKETNLPANAILVGLVGRYHPMKDHLSFLRAAADLIKTHPGVYFALVGQNTDRNNADLTALVVSLGLQKKVLQLGQRDDIAAISAALDISVSASKTEGFPNVVGEAMSCAVPCVVTDVGDSAWIVNDTGYVVNPGDYRDLANALRKLVDLGEAGRRTLGLKARERVIHLFEISNIAGRYTRLYASIHRLRANHRRLDSRQAPMLRSGKEG